MKLSKLYSNQSDLFQPINFVDGLNVVMAEIHQPKDRKKDTHNLGKTTLVRLLDFVLLATNDSNFFLFKHKEKFEDFTFFLEIKLDDNSFVTIRRSVKEASKISFKRDKAKYQDFSETPDAEWDHCNVPFKNARELLDGMLDWHGLKTWAYRKIIGYLLRSQSDYQDVFQLSKFKGKHGDWKPFLAHILGFDDKLITKYYEKEDQLSKEKDISENIKKGLGADIEDINKIKGILLIKQEEIEKKQKELDAFDFRDQDKDSTKKLVDEIDRNIADLNAKRYSLNFNLKKITDSLKEDRILFDPDAAQVLFKEAGIAFQGQIKKDFQQLIAFNQAITDERRGYLQEEQKEIKAELKEIDANLNALGGQRSQTLAFLSKTDVFDKYKDVSNEIVAMKAEVISLKNRLMVLNKLLLKAKEIREIKYDHDSLQVKIEENVNEQSSDKNSLFSTIRLYFNEIIKAVIDREAVLSVLVNKEGHLVFRAEILDEKGGSTGADLGHTYRKLLCIAFDLAVLRAHLKEKFPRFVYHDGVFETLDDRKKENLLAVIRYYGELGLQPIITLIDSDLPKRDDDKPIFSKDEIVLTLHDKDQSGRLFRMQAW